MAAGHLYNRKGYADVKELGTDDAYAASEDVVLQVTIRVPRYTMEDLKPAAKAAIADRKERERQAKRDEIDKQLDDARRLEADLLEQRAAI